MAEEITDPVLRQLDAAQASLMSAAVAIDTARTMYLASHEVMSSDPAPAEEQLQFALERAVHKTVGGSMQTMSS